MRFDSPLEALKVLSAVPSSPFLPGPRINFLNNFIVDKQLEIIPDDYSLIIKAGSGKRKLVLMTHLDHPGIVLNNRHEGTIFGSVGHERILAHLKNSPIPIKIFDPSGKYLTHGHLTNLAGRNLEKVQITTDHDIPPNSSASWDMADYYEKGDKVYAYAADNDVPTAVMLTLLSYPLSSIYDLYFVFNYFEEVHQISSFHLAKQNILKLTKNDLVLNLESMKVGNYEHPKINSALDYENSVILQINELDCLYGNSFREENALERLIFDVIKKNKIKIQRGLGKGSTDARPFSQFNLTPNIVTLNVPNQFKHNHGDNGEIIPEKVYKQDVSSMYEIVDKLINPPKSSDKKIKYESISSKIKKSDNITSASFLNQKMLLNERLDLAYHQTIKTHLYYQTSPMAKIADLFSKFCSYLVYVYLWVLTKLS